MPDSKKFEHPMYGLSNEESHRLTIESIEEALLLLVKQKPLSRLSVTDIVKKKPASHGRHFTATIPPKRMYCALSPCATQEKCTGKCAASAMTLTVPIIGPGCFPMPENTLTSTR